MGCLLEAEGEAGEPAGGASEGGDAAAGPPGGTGAAAQINAESPLGKLAYLVHDLARHTPAGALPTTAGLVLHFSSPVASGCNTALWKRQDVQHRTCSWFAAVFDSNRRQLMLLYQAL